METRDIIVVGASLGGVDALRDLVGQLPPDLPAAVFLVLHTAPESPGALASILDRRGPLPAVTAVDQMPIERGRIYVAPPNRHLLVLQDQVRVRFGPRENRARPAIDPLFRTAAVNHRSRVIGVVLTGLLGDGSAGLRAVQQCGGLPLVQAPEDAAYPEMPARAMAAAPDARPVRLQELGATLARLSAEPAPAPPPVPELLEVEARLTERALMDDDWTRVPGTPTNYTCPECNGSLREIADQGPRRFRCRVGHAYSLADMLGDKAKSAEETLWVAL